MSGPKFFVVARVTGRENALPLWKARIVSLCNVSATEKLGDTYYWGSSLEGDPDTICGLEGYTHAVGFFIGHFETKVFKEQGALIDSDRLLKHEQGLDSRDYDLHHYDLVGGFLKRQNDPDRDAKDSIIAVYHFWSTTDETRPEILEKLLAFVNKYRPGELDSSVQSAIVLKEIRFPTMATLWLRVRTLDAFAAFEASETFTELIDTITPLTSKSDKYKAAAFNGHLDLKYATT
ncbi:uncharacterized protein V2V93DRAFT_375697 [Kockiozyma suomiensis]|uniref:uncharacterized protein n=1 Tax=Kockiozyma suomiensis TaxID=1337062 RepID=UPI003343EDE6